jgi:hypothetical protein
MGFKIGNFKPLVNDLVLFWHSKPYKGKQTVNLVNRNPRLFASYPQAA